METTNNFPGYFGFSYQNKYYVVKDFDSRKEILGRKIVSEIRQALLDGTYETWIDKIKKFETNQQMERKETGKETTHVDELSDILEHQVYDKNHNGIPNFENYSYIVNLDTQQLNLYNGYRVIDNYHLDLYFLPKW